MRLLLVLAVLVGTVLSTPLPARYSIRRPPNAVSLHGAARRHNSRGRQFRIDHDSIERPLSRSRFSVKLDDSHESHEVRCPSGQLPHGGRCVIPRINRNIFVFGKEEESHESVETVLPLPEIDYNIIFVRSRPQRPKSPVVVPPPQKKTVVYVLEDEIHSEEDVIQIPYHPEADPEVYYVKVKPGENPQLPGGIDLQTAYSQAIRPLNKVGSHESSVESSFGSGGFRGDIDDDSIPFGGGAGSDFGVPLPDPSFNDGGVGVPLPDPTLSGAGGSSFDSFDDNFGGPGVPLPDIRSDFEGQGSLRNFDDSSFGTTGGFVPTGGRNLELDVEDGRVTVDVASKELIQSALRYNVPREG